MSLENYQRLYELETTPEALAATCRYLEERFRKFLKKVLHAKYLCLLLKKFQNIRHILLVLTNSQFLKLII